MSDLCGVRDESRPAVNPCRLEVGHTGLHEGWHPGGNSTSWSDVHLNAGIDTVLISKPAVWWSASDGHMTPAEFLAAELADEPVVVPSFQDVFLSIFDETYNLLIERQKKYGPKNIEEQGLFGVFGRIYNDKMQRIKRALNGKVVHGNIVLDEVEDPEDDTFEDALMDVANYALIMLALKRGVWGAPLEDE